MADARACLFLLVVLFSWNAQSAVTLTPLPGSTPQVARPWQQFAVPLGVVATDDSGAPVAGLPVYFGFTSPFEIPGYGGGTTFTTDSNGIAVVPFPGVRWASTIGGGGTFFATAPDATNAQFDLTAQGLPPSRIGSTMGASQIGPPDGILNPFGVRVVDSTLTPVANIWVAYGVIPGNSGASGTFNGPGSTLTDSDGWAVTPTLTLNEKPGRDAVVAFSVPNVTPRFLGFGVSTPTPVTLTPVPGSTPQATCPFCYFPMRVGVIARNLDGTPAAGVNVRFTPSGDSIQMPPQGSLPTVATTGPDGIAYAASTQSPAGFMALGAGTSQVIATTPGAATPAIFDLTVSGKPPTRLQYLSGDGQVAQIGHELAPWVVRAFDEDGQPVPLAALMIEVGNLPGDAGFVLPNGEDELVGPADSGGVFTTASLAANGIAGSNAFGAVFLPMQPGNLATPNLFFHFTNVAGDPGFGALRAWASPPPSIAAGDTAAIPYSVMALDAAGQGVANVPVTFTADHSCASLGGARTVTVATDARGIAASPLLAASHAKAACEISVIGAGATLGFSVDVYDPKKLDAAGSVPFVNAAPNDAFEVDVAFTDKKKEVEVTDFAVRVLSVPNGASVAGPPLVSIGGDGTTAFVFQTNGGTGGYAIEIIAGGSRLRVPVLQKP